VVNDQEVLVPPVTTQLTKVGWVEDIVRAIEQGEVVLIENIGEEVDSTLEPVLSRAIIRKGRNQFIKFAGRELEYDPKFRLFLFTKLSNPHYKPEMQAQCTLINFTATEKGLEDQLLVRVVQAERPDKEAERQQLQGDLNGFKLQLTDLEDDLLQKLSNAPEDILSDGKLIESLEATKGEAEKINKAVASSEEVMQDISKIRDSYRPVAAEASMLYFMLTRMCTVNHMYQYSLESFVQFFNKAIREAPGGGSPAATAAVPECADSGEGANGAAAEGSGTSGNEMSVVDRVSGLRDTLRFTIFQFVSRGLFERHKELFLAQLTFNLMQRGQLACSGDWSDEAFDFLLQPPFERMSGENPLSEWLPDSAWNAITALARLSDFENLPNDMIEASPRFRDWYNNSAPEQEKLPLDWAQLDKAFFMKLLVIKCLRPDRMQVAIDNFVRQNLPDGDKFADCDSTLNSFDLLLEVFGDSSPTVPLYFILSPGTDVMSDLDRLAAGFGLEKGRTYVNVSLGQGQDKVATRLLETAHKEGHFVVLNNLHLMPKWLPHLEKLLDQFKDQGSHENFRLFLSSDPSDRIPISMLGRCIKLTNEAPSGLKANLKRAFLSFPRTFVEESDARVKSILFGLSYFHCAMTERKRFGPTGFNIMYPFSLGDLRDSAVCLNNYMESSQSGVVPWTDIRYIFGEIIYGGHVVNDFDRLLVNTMLEYLMRDELLDEMELFPFVESSSTSLKAPEPTTVERYLEYIDENIRGDTPMAYGLNPNAEIDFRTQQSAELFALLDGLRAGDKLGGASNSSIIAPQLTAENLTGEILDRFGGEVLDVDAVVELTSETSSPFQSVLLQEMGALNVLLQEMRRSLLELTQGFAGELTITEGMDGLIESLHQNVVPASWARLAWPSTRTMSSWLNDLAARIAQVTAWSANPSETLRVTWLPGLVFPQGFLTAIKQTTSQRTSTELDVLTIMTDVVKNKSLEDCMEAPPRDGAYIHGLFMQGARWNMSDANIETSRPRELFCAMPVICCRAARQDKVQDAKAYSCPVYKTLQRGPTYVFSAQLKTKVTPAKWILAGVALVMDVGV